MQQFDTVITGHIIDAQREIPVGFIAIKGGKIALLGAVAQGLPAASSYFDYTDCMIFPGVIDCQVHSCSQQGQEDFIWSTRAAAAGGVTTIVDMPYDAGRLICNAERFRQKRQQAEEQARVDFALYATIHPEEGITRIPELVAAGAVGFKFSTFGTDPDRFPRLPSYLLHDCFTELSRYGLVAAVHNEDDETVKQLIKRVQQQGITDYRAHTLSRPVYSETLAIQQIYELAVDTGCHAHVVHCSTGRGYEICVGYRQQGYPVTIESCLHYLVLCEEEDVARLGGLAKVNPPVRSCVEREAIWQYLAAGNVTVVSTDHVSWSLERKNSADMLANASGLTGLEVLLPLLIDGATARNIPLTRLAQVLAENPAKLFRIDHLKGAIEVGKDADLAIVRPETYHYYAKESGHNFVDWSPYDGRTLNHRVVATMLRGDWVFTQQQGVANAGGGQFLAPSLCGR